MKSLPIMFAAAVMCAGVVVLDQAAAEPTWQIVLETVDGKSYVADHGMSLEDCEDRFRGLDASLPLSVALIYCEREV